MRKKVLIALVVVAVISVLPVCVAVINLKEYDEVLAEGKVIVEFWYPSDTKIFTELAEWEKEFPQADRPDQSIFLLNFTDYKEKLGGEKHFILVQGDGGTIYHTRQGKVIVRAVKGLWKPCARYKVGNPTYLGNDKMSFPIMEESPNARRQIIFLGVMGGLMLDGVLFVLVSVVAVMGLIVGDIIFSLLIQKRP